VQRETYGRATRGLSRATSAHSEDRATSAHSGDQRGARPVARATGRAEYQPVRVTSALKKGPRATSAGLAETSRRSETSGASCRTSQEPAVPRDKRAQKRISHQGRRPRGKRARREPNFGWRPVRAARRSSRTAESGRPPCAEVALSGVKRRRSVLDPTIQAI